MMILSVSSGGMRSVVLCHEPRRGPAQPGFVHATGAGDVAKGKLERIEPHVLREALVPGCARLRGLDELFHDRLEARLITGETISEVPRLSLKRLDQRDHILHRQTRARSNGEMRGAQCVSNQHHVAEAPSLIP